MEQTSPLVSVIIPNFNRSELIGFTLDSIINQTYTNWECIVVDDGSTDNSNEVVKSYNKLDPRIKLYNRPNDKEKGANACRNYGFGISNGVFINWFDSDDLMHPEKLQIQVSELLKSKHDFTVCQTLVFEGDLNNILGLRKEKIYSQDFFNDFVTNDIKWLTQAPLFKKAFILKNQLTFDETLQQSQERDFFIKVLDVVKDYHFNETPMVYFRKHDKSISYGKKNESKLKSNFTVNYRILTNYSNKLSSKSKLKLLKSLKYVLYLSLQSKYNELSKYIYDKILDLKMLTRKDFIKLKLGYFCMNKIGKGFFLFK